MIVDHGVARRLGGDKPHHYIVIKPVDQIPVVSIQSARVYGRRWPDKRP